LSGVSTNFPAFVRKGVCRKGVKSAVDLCSTVQAGNYGQASGLPINCPEVKRPDQRTVCGFFFFSKQGDHQESGTMRPGINTEFGALGRARNLFNEEFRGHNT